MSERIAIGFRAKLKARQKEVDSLVCVGLDPLLDKIPECIPNLPDHERVYVHMRDIIDATAPFACMFKPQSAYYEAIPHGRETLQKLVNYIHAVHPGIPVFLDCKRGDIGRTQERYSMAHLELDSVDGMNFSPYMGKDCMEFLARQDKPGAAIVGLCYTSNPAARQIQDVELSDGRYLWEFIAETTLEWANELGIIENAGLVMAAAYEDPNKPGNVISEHLSRCRRIVGNKMWFLIPGVGTQGGLIGETVENGHKKLGDMAISSSSGITFKSAGEDYAEASGIETDKLRNEINEHR